MMQKNERNGLKPVCILLAALMGILVSVCFAQPAAPEVVIEVVTEVDGDYVHLNWEPVEGTVSYNIYSSFDPNVEDWGFPVATVNDNHYTTAVDDDKVRFYYVTAYAEDVMVLVDGRDQYNGNVTIDPFYISKFQVTQEEYAAVIGFNPSYFADENGVPNHENLPVEMVSWFDAIEYCNRLSIQEGLTPVYTYNDRTNPNEWYDLWPGWNENDGNHTNVSANWAADGYRLPTEVEWHYAANSGIHNPESGWDYGSPYQYSGSDDIDEVAWYSGNAGETTHPVGELEPNNLGIYDMSGNVWELCWDIFQANPYPSGSYNPRGAVTGSSRVIKGGSWNWGAGTCRVYLRNYANRATLSGFNLGFRVARSNP